jgi:hypothetical protein
MQQSRKEDELKSHFMGIGGGSDNNIGVCG